MTIHRIISPKKQLGIEALITENSAAGAALRVGVGIRTMRRWLRDDAFKAALDEARTKCVDDARHELGWASLFAARTLIKELRNVSPNVRVHAAKIILELSARERTDDELERRLALLEKTVR